MKKLILIHCLISLTLLLSGIQLDIDLNHFSVNDLRDIQENCKYREDIGSPALPFVSRMIVIPYGNMISKCDYTATSDSISIPFKIPSIQPNIPYTDGQISYTINNEIYSSNKIYPAKPYEIVGVHRKNGVDIAIVRLFPFQYSPIENKVIINKSLSLNVITNYDEELANKQSMKLLKPNFLQNIIASMDLANPEVIRSYFNRDNISYNPRTSLVSPSNPYEYIIISSLGYSNEWTEFINHKTGMGVNVGLFVTTDIYSNYSGRDNAEKLRNFIIDAYSTWSSTDEPLQYVLLGGDRVQIPERYMKVTAYYNSSWYNNSVISDHYYSSLDGDWDNDQDNLFGEGDYSIHNEAGGMAGDEADYLSELSIGRASCDSITYLQNWISKTIDYENSLIEANYLKRVGLVGEYLGSGIWGSSHQNEIGTYLDDFYITKLYERESNFSKATVTNLINNGVNIISHIGHGRSAYVMDIYESDVDTLLINDNYCFIYTQACGTANIAGVSAIGEVLIKYPHGAFAYIGNTNYGFYSSFYNQGPSQFYNREFFDAVVYEGIEEIGRANTDSKEDILDLVSTVGTMRQTYFELILLGDPILSLHKNVATLKAEQTFDNEITLHLEDFNPDNSAYSGSYTVRQRDNDTSSIPVSAINVLGNDIILTLSEDIPNGIPYSIEISNITGVSGTLVRTISMLSNIRELSVITNETWTVANSPYYIYKYLFVNNSLNIEPGVEIRINDDVGIFIHDNGNLSAEGSEDNPIVFSGYNTDSDSEGDWVDITFYRDSAIIGNILSYCILENSNSGIWIDSTAVVSISNCMIINCPDNGLNSYYGEQDIDRVVIAYNSSSTADEGLYMEGVNSIIDNLTFYGNGLANFNVINSELFIRNSIIRELNGTISSSGSNITIEYSNVQGGYSGNGNIDVNPMFVNPNEYNYSLSEGSPCIDAGYVYDNLDPDDTIPDMGAIYYHHPISFSAQYLTGDAPLRIPFINESGGVPDRIQWDFDGDNIWDAEGNNPEYTYLVAGSYDVILRLEKDAWSDTLTLLDYIVVTDNELDYIDNPLITIDSNNLQLNWNGNPACDYYLIYSSDNPYEEFNFYQYTTDNYIVNPIINNRKFYLIKRVVISP